VIGGSGPAHFLKSIHYLSRGKCCVPSETDPRPASRLRLLDDGTERSGRADPPEGYAGDPDDARGMRRVDACAVG
jgi:hypothetical protein